MDMVVGRWRHMGKIFLPHPAADIGITAIAFDKQVPGVVTLTPTEMAYIIPLT